MADPAAHTDEELAEMAAFLIWVGHHGLCLVGDACDCEAITEGTRRLIAALRASRAEVELLQGDLEFEQSEHIRLLGKVVNERKNLTKQVQRLTEQVERLTEELRGIAQEWGIDRPDLERRDTQ